MGAPVNKGFLKSVAISVTAGVIVALVVQRMSATTNKPEDNGVWV